ncbi:hypothetical protein ATCC90586_001151 [Pythium insidiosum]|nr:hypothetical protein ATCC90586_001151 [Pythium insidiosum]
MTQFLERLKDVAPILTWLPQYNVQRDLKFDVISGVTVAMMLIPQEISLANIMKVPPQYALYNAAIGPLVYAVFGSSKVLSVASGSGVALIVGTILEKIPSEKERIATGILLSFLCGATLLLIRLLHLSEIADFFSRPVMGGFISAVGLLIMLSQVPSWLSINAGNATYPAETIYRIAKRIDKTEMNSFTVGLVSIIILFTLKWAKQRFFSNASLNEIFAEAAAQLQAHHKRQDRGSARSPSMLNEPILPPDLHSHGFSLNDQQFHQMEGERNARRPAAVIKPRSSSKAVAILLFLGRTFCDLAPLVVCVLGGVAGYSLGPKKIRVTGKVPGKLPMPIEPWYGFYDIIAVDKLGSILLSSLSVTLVLLVSSLAIGKRLAVKRGQDIRGDQELMALGLANVACAFFRAVPSTGGLSRTAVNFQNARTQLASIITATIVIISLYSLTSTLFYIPRATLASIIIVAGYSLVEFKEAAWLYRVKRDEFYVWLGCFIATLIFGLDQGLIASLIVSLVGVMVKTKRPGVSVLGESASGDLVERHHESFAHELQDLVVVRLYNSLYFANCVRLTQVIDDELERRRRENTQVHGVAIDLFHVNDLDATAIQVISDMQEKLEFRGIAVALANANEIVAKSLSMTALVKRIAGQTPQQGLLEATRRLTEAEPEPSSAQ